MASRDLGRAARGRGARLPDRDPGATGATSSRSRTASTRASSTALRSLGIDGLYPHQADAFARGRARRARRRRDRDRERQDARVQPPGPRTRSRRSRSSARSTCTRRRRSPRTRRARSPRFKLPRLRPAIYDGDTETERRWQIRKWANVILTNPDMLHVGVLPHHDRWGDVLSEPPLRRRRRGARLPRRLRLARRRTCCAGCAAPQRSTAPSRSSCSPRRRSPTRASSSQSLLGVEATVIGEDAAPRAARTVAFWNPPLLDEELQLRASALGEGAKLLADLVERGLRTICFAKSREGGRADPPLRLRARRAGARRRASRPTAPATRRRSGARSSGGSSRASCSA